MYKLSLGSLGADEMVEVTVCFSIALRSDASDANTYRLVLPTALLHRYMPAGGDKEVERAVDTTVAAIAAAEADGKEQPPLRLSFAAFGHAGVVSITSPSHAAYLAPQDLPRGGKALSGGVPADTCVQCVRTIHALWMCHTFHAVGWIPSVTQTCKS